MGKNVFLHRAGKGISDHGELDGLSDDDHTQYLLVDGTRPLTADWDAGTAEIRSLTFQSDQATGTAPLLITSTTKVVNLNVDQVDGLHVGTSSGAIPNMAADNTWAGTQTFADSGGEDIRIGTKILHDGDTNTFIEFGTDDVSITAGGDKYFSFQAPVLTPVAQINPGGIDMDFQVQGENKVNLLYVDGSTDGIGINTAEPAHFLHIVSDVTSKSGLLVTKNVASSSAAVADFIQDHTTAGIPTVRMQQDDVSEGVIDLIASDRGSITTYDASDPFSSKSSVASVRVELNGTVYRWLLWADG